MKRLDEIIVKRYSKFLYYLIIIIRGIHAYS